MKKILYITLLAALVTGCSNAKKEEQAIQKQVLDSHDKVMAADVKAADAKIKLDSMVKHADSTKLDKQAAMIISTKLNYADNAMSDWMSKLNLENNGMNHDAIMQYWRTQQIKVKMIDSLLTAANAEAEAFIQKNSRK